jgi:menaquinone-9 beta-reductase
VSPEPFDVVVVGGGPVGLYAASRAALRGWTVGVIEQRPWPIDKACGEGLMPAALSLLQRLDVDPVGHPFWGITYLDAAGVRKASAYFGAGPGRGVRRLVLSEELLRRTQDLKVELVRARAVGLEQRADAVSVNLSGGDSLTARYVLGADGLHSKVRRWAGISSRTPTPSRVGLRRHFTAKPWSTTVEVYWSARGEAYVTPVSADEVGVALLGPSHDGNFDEKIGAFPALLDRLEGATASGVDLGKGPLWQDVASRTCGRVLLVGDAAGYVDALTGEGLAMGFRCADAAVEAIDRGDLGAYEQSWRRITRQYRMLTGGLVQATRNGLVRRGLVPSAQSVPSAFSFVVNRLG